MRHQATSASSVRQAYARAFAGLVELFGTLRRWYGDVSFDPGLGRDPLCDHAPELSLRLGNQRARAHSVCCARGALRGVEIRRLINEPARLPLPHPGV